VSKGVVLSIEKKVCFFPQKLFILCKYKRAGGTSPQKLCSKKRPEKFQVKMFGILNLKTLSPVAFRSSSGNCLLHFASWNSVKTSQKIFR
jgi:hypothetical protein